MRRTLAVIAAYFHVVSSLSVQPPSGSLGKGPPGGPAPPQLPELEIAPPPSWGSPAWKWGRGDGAAHEVAKRVRADFAKRHRRSSFLAWAKCGTVEVADLKMVLALSCQRARNMRYDDADGRWEALMDEMADAKYVAHDGLIDLPALAAAVNDRLDEPLSFEDADCGLEEYPGAVVARALVHLDFVNRGL
jgi:hypothetical protein